MTKNLLPLAIGVGIGGALVYWWIKRSCPCQHDAKAVATATAPAVPPESFGGLDEDGPSAVGLASAPLFPEDAAAMSANESIGGELFPGSSSGATNGGTFTSGCSSCGSSIMTAPTAPMAPTGLTFANTGISTFGGAAGPVLL